MGLMELMELSFVVYLKTVSLELSNATVFMFNFFFSSFNQNMYDQYSQDIDLTKSEKKK